MKEWLDVIPMSTLLSSDLATPSSLRSLSMSLRILPTSASATIAPDLVMCTLVDPYKHPMEQNTKTYHNDLIILHLDLSSLLFQLHLGRPIRPGLVACMMVVGDFAQDHEIHLVVPVGVDLDGAMVTAGDVRPDCFTEVADFWVWICVNIK